MRISDWSSDVCSSDLRLRALLQRFHGDFLDGMTVDRSPLFNSWLAARRRRFRSIRIAAVERLATILPAGSDETLALLEDWLVLAPVDVRAHRDRKSTRLNSSH